MTITHHPADELLLRYAAGATDEATSLILATHLALCPICRDTVADAEAVGGALLVSGHPVALKSNALESVIARLDDTVPLPKRPKPEPAPATGVVEPLRSYIGGSFDDVRWNKITRGISFKPLFKSGNARVQLIRTKPGQGVGLHTHRGEEFTLIMTGGYTDVTGHYTRGDLHSATPDILHRPLADEGEDCIVLAVSDAPLKFHNPAVGLIGKIFGF
ncbi:MAG: ChrR family anti-sigma-E factor [Rhizomicrobium sp.]|jgi:putative transcriptional regulator